MAEAAGDAGTACDQMAIIDDYASIATELRRIQGEKRPEGDAPEASGQRPSPSHRMRATVVGDLLYRRLVTRSRHPG